MTQSLRQSLRQSLKTTVARGSQGLTSGTPPVLDGGRTRADEDDVALQGLCLAALGGLQSERDAAAADDAAGDLGVELELEALLRQRALEGLPQLAVLRSGFGVQGC